MARESCNLDKDEAEILTPSSSSSSPTPVTVSPPPASSAPPSLFLKPASVHEFTAQRAERQEVFVSAAEPDEEERPPAIRFANRCTSCRKKVGLTGFRCRCGELFCPRHRYSDTHDCSFDYKAAGRDEISKNNPLIRAAKIIKI